MRMEPQALSDWNVDLPIQPSSLTYIGQHWKILVFVSLLTCWYAFFYAIHVGTFDTLPLLEVFLYIRDETLGILSHF